MWIEPNVAVAVMIGFIILYAIKNKRSIELDVTKNGVRIVTLDQPNSQKPLQSAEVVDRQAPCKKHAQVSSTPDPHSSSVHDAQLGVREVHRPFG